MAGEVIGNDTALWSAVATTPLWLDACWHSAAGAPTGGLNKEHK